MFPSGLRKLEKLSFEKIPSEKKDFYLLKKLFTVFDFLIEKVNREYIPKGPVIDKIVLGLFFICINSETFISSLTKVMENLFLEKENFDKFTSTLKIEEVLKLLQDKNFEEIFFIWKSCCQIRRTYKTNKDLIYQQMDENFKDENQDWDKKGLDHKSLDS